MGTASTEKPELRYFVQALKSLTICSIGSVSLLPLLVFAEPVSEHPGSTAGNVPGTMLSSVFLEANEATIGEITIDNGNIFDLDDPEEDKWLYQLANKTHVTTRPEAIRQQLLFDTGDAFSGRLLEESERILRSNRYIQDAAITPVRFVNGVADINVRTTDTWTFVPKLDFSRKGGENKSALGFKEMNLLGTGMQVELAYESDVDRDSTIMKFVDRHLGNSWYSLDMIYSDNSDGYTRSFNLSRPFFSFDTTFAGGVSYFDNDQIQSLYERGEAYSRFRHRGTSYEIFGGWSNGLKSGWTRRYTAGIGYDSHEFASIDDWITPASIIPKNRKLLYPFFGIELLQDKYEKGQNYNQISRTEDHYLGTRLAVRLGYAGASFGSDRDAWLIYARAQTAYGTIENSTLFLSANVDARWEDSGLENFVAQASARYYKRQSKHRLFFASLHATYGHDLDLDNQLLLGGDNGLRGYPLRYLGGDRKAVLTLEQRFFTDWYPFRLFRVGGAVFFDAGRTWGATFTGSDNPGIQKDIGFGLRLGNSRSGEGNMIHVDLAFPLDGDGSIDSMQLLIETKKSF